MRWVVKHLFHPIHQEDLKFRTWNEVLKPDSKSCCISDDGYEWIDGNMGEIYGT